MSRQPFVKRRLEITGRSPEYEAPTMEELEERAYSAHSIEARNLLVDMILTRRERDALLEALKKARGKLIDAGTHSGDEARRMVNDAESILWSAIANVEGNDG